MLTEILSTNLFFSFWLNWKVDSKSSAVSIHPWALAAARNPVLLVFCPSIACIIDAPRRLCLLQTLAANLQVSM